MYQLIKEFDETTREANAISDNYECEIRDMSKKVQKQELTMEDTLEALQQAASNMELADNNFSDMEEDVNAQTRRVLLLEEESTTSVEKLAVTAMKLASISKEADNIVKGSRHWENKTMNNEMEIETMDKGTRNAIKMGKKELDIFCIKKSIFRE